MCTNDAIWKVYWKLTFGLTLWMWFSRNGKLKKKLNLLFTKAAAEILGWTMLLEDESNIAFISNFNYLKLKIT